MCSSKPFSLAAGTKCYNYGKAGQPAETIVLFEKQADGGISRKRALAQPNINRPKLFQFAV